MCRPDTSVSAKQPSAAADASATLNVKLSKEDEWLKSFDYEGFTTEIRELGKKLSAAQDQSDVDHLNYMILWSNICAAVGLLTMGFIRYNPISILGLSLYAFSRWTMIAHHTCHGGYENCHPEAKNRGRWSRFTFGLGNLWRRWNDWFDWMMPEAWNVEHNNRHHYNLSEITDPDLVEQNSQTIREMQAPMFLKYLNVSALVVTWKWMYYAPNTYKELKLAHMRRTGQVIPPHIEAEQPVLIGSIIKSVLSGGKIYPEATYFYSLFELLTIVLLPYLVIHFFITPLPWLLVGKYMGATEDDSIDTTFYWNAVVNLFLAELLTNAHGFLAVVTNHAGDDMYRFRKPCRPFSGSFYLRQVLASVDYNMGTNLIDFLHGWLNYQIEHHMWPNLSMKQYQISAPQVKAICNKYGVPYVQENVFKRLKKTTDIMVGKTSMRWFPEQYEDLFLELDAIAERKAFDEKTSKINSNMEDKKEK